MYKTLFLLLLLIDNVFAELSIQYTDLRFPEAAPHIFEKGLAVIIGVVIFLIGAIIYQDRKQKKSGEIITEQTFLKKCARFGLLPKEISVLRHYVKKHTLTPLPTVFSLLSVFEEVVDGECVEIVARSGLTSKAENETQMLEILRKKLGFDQVVTELPIFSSRNILLGQTFDILQHEGENPLIKSALATERSELVLGIRYNPQNAGVIPNPLTKVFIQFTRQGDGMYTIPVDVVDINPSSQTIRVKQTGKVNRLQFRDFVRIQVEVPLQCRLIHRENAAKNAPLGILLEHCTILDIGGGGMAFISDTELKREDSVSLSFSLDSRRFILKGFVVDVSKKDIRGTFRFKHRISFVSIDPKDSDGIVHYVFERQREQLQMQPGATS